VNEGIERRSGGLSRRGLLRSGLIVGLGAAGLTAASAGVAHADDEQIGSAVTSNGTTVGFTNQLDWYYCKLCRNLYYGPHNGLCVDGYSTHQPYSETNYGVPASAPLNTVSGAGSLVQSPWAYCSQCACLFWGPEESTSYCATDGIGGPRTHNDSSSGAYYMMNGTWSGGSENVQPGWRYCGNCKVLYWGGAWQSSLCQYQFASIGGPNLNNGNNDYGHAPGDTVYYLFLY
jgi:hypothetical protein